MSARYQLTRRLESGELAELFLGTRDDEPVVVKLFHQKTSDVRYARELAETSRLINPLEGRGFVHVVDMGLVKSRLAVVRQHVEGLSLGEALVRLGTREVLLHPPVALHFVIQLLEAVGRAHDAGAVHGAITPGNILLSAEGDVGVFDFGALRALQAVPALKSLTGKGRDSYRAAEVVKGEEPTALSDIYSIGAIAYELLTLREPVVASGVSTRREALPGPSRVDRRLNGRIDPVILRALDASPTRRFRSCAEFASGLRNFLANNGGMPVQDDVRKFVADVSGREQKPAPGPVPFEEPFTLSAVEGADVPPVAAIERSSTGVMPRVAFTGPADPLLEPYAQDTVEAPPAFEEYKPPAKSRPEQRPEPRFDEGTDPGQAGPLEMGWVAPPGAAPLPPRKMSLAAMPAGKTSARNTRVRVIEDFAVKEPSAEPEPPEEVTAMATAADRKKLAATPPAAKDRSGARPAPRPPTPAPEAPGPILTPNDVVPRPLASSGLSASTDSRDLFAGERKRRQLMWMALAIAAVAVVSFAFAIRSFRDRNRPTTPGRAAQVEPPGGTRAATDPGSRSVDGALKKYLETEQAGSATPGRATPIEPARPSRAQDTISYDEPPPKTRAGFLTVTTDSPVAIYIDGLRVKRKAPFARYPVRPGDRKIGIECLETLERKPPMQLGFIKGKERHLDQHCRSH